MDIHIGDVVEVIYENNVFTGEVYENNGDLYVGHIPIRSATVNSVITKDEANQIVNEVFKGME